jgi:hypothetical protein
LGCALDDGTGAPWTYDNRFPTPLRVALEGILPVARARFRLRPLGPLLFEVDWLAGACLFLRRDVLRVVGLLDEGFFLYKEDVDLCLRLRESGYRNVLCQEVRLTHLIAQSTRRNPRRDGGRAHLEGYRSSARYARKHFGPVIGTVVALSLRVGLLVRLLKAAVGYVTLGSARDKSKIEWMRRALCARDRFAVEDAPRLEADAWKERA